MIKGGYYIKARCIQDSEIAIAPPHVREIWDWLLKEANHKDKKISKKIIKRGECIRTYKDIIDGLKWKVGFRTERYSKWQCEMAMKWLTKADMIHTTRTTRGILIKIDKYDYYQNPKNYESHTRATMKATREPQHRHTLNKNDKNDKNKEYRERSKQVTKDFLEKLQKDERFSKLDVLEEFESWKDWKASKGRKFKDNQAAFRNWLRKAKTFTREKQGNPIIESPTFKRWCEFSAIGDSRQAHLASQLDREFPAYKYQEEWEEARVVRNNYMKKTTTDNRPEKVKSFLKKAHENIG